jgi:hypothetical protein
VHLPVTEADQHRGVRRHAFGDAGQVAGDGQSAQSARVDAGRSSRRDMDQSAVPFEQLHDIGANPSGGHQDSLDAGDRTEPLRHPPGDGPARQSRTCGQIMFQN